MKKICDTCKNIFSINSFNIINENQVDNIINLNTLEINKREK